MTFQVFSETKKKGIVFIMKNTINFELSPIDVINVIANMDPWAQRLAVLSIAGFCYIKYFKENNIKC